MDLNTHMAVMPEIKTWDSESRVIVQTKEELFFTEKCQLANRMKK